MYNANFTETQQLALNSMMKGRNVFVTGPGGTGKSFCIFYFLAKMREAGIEKEQIAVTSTTGISASLIGGTTLHRFAGIGLGNKSFDYYFDSISRDHFRKRRWTKCKILIIDEVSMLSPRLFEMLDCLARKLRRKCDEPFGGIQIILLGDFCQLPTVKEKQFCFEAINWDDVIDETFYLTEIMRQSDEKFQGVLNKIRMGNVDEKVKELLNSRVGVKLDLSEGIEPTIIYSKRNQVEKYNDKKENELKESGADSNIYLSNYDYARDMSEAAKKYLKDFIDSNYNITNELELQVGTQVMVNANFPERKLYNGSRGVVIGFTELKVPIVRFLDKRELRMKPHEWKFEGNNNSFVIKKQIPLVVAWAITIHKSQGMSLDYVSTSIGESIFEYGQVYVVLSRARNLDGLTIKKIDFNKIIAHPKVVEYYNNL